MKLTSENNLNKWFFIVLIVVTIIATLILWLINPLKFGIFHTATAVFTYLTVTPILIYFSLKNLNQIFKNIGGIKLEVIGSIICLLSGFIGGSCAGYVWWLFNNHTNSLPDIILSSGILGAIIIGLLFGA